MEEQEVREQPNYYAIIPASVRYDERLRDKAKLLYGEITALSNASGECWASNNYFSDLYKIVPETTSRIISELVELGYLERKIIYKRGTKEIDKRILIPIDKKINTYCQKNQEGIVQKVKENNTSINNTRINNSSSSATSNLFDFIEQNFGRTLNTIEIQKILNWKDTELTRYAIEKAILNNKYSIGYIDGILRNFEINNIKTIQEAQAEENSFKKTRLVKSKKTNDIEIAKWLNEEIEKQEINKEELEELENEFKQFK